MVDHGCYGRVVLPKVAGPQQKTSAADHSTRSGNATGRVHRRSISATSVSREMTPKAGGNHLRALRAKSKTRRAYVRVEPVPGERFDIDWGHFGALLYSARRESSMHFVWSKPTAAECIWS